MEHHFKPEIVDAMRHGTELHKNVLHYLEHYMEALGEFGAAIPSRDFEAIALAWMTLDEFHERCMTYIEAWLDVRDYEEEANGGTTGRP